jgi:hypothetical protein
MTSADLAEPPPADLASPPIAPLWPIKIGSTWSYAASGYCSGTVDRTVVSANAVDGRAAFQIDDSSAACTTVAESYSLPGGDQVDIDILGTWSTLIDPVLQEGHSWAYYGSTMLTWHRETSVTVPAGTFTDCWTANSSDPSIPSDTYCRGVGPVQSHSSSLDLQLTAWSL